MGGIEVVAIEVVVEAHRANSNTTQHTGKLECLSSSQLPYMDIYHSFERARLRAYHGPPPIVCHPPSEMHQLHPACPRGVEGGGKLSNLLAGCWPLISRFILRRNYRVLRSKSPHCTLPIDVCCSKICQAPASPRFRNVPPYRPETSYAPRERRFGSHP